MHIIRDLRMKEEATGEDLKGALSSKIRRIAIPLSSWEILMMSENEASIFRALRSFPDVEEIVLVVGRISYQVLDHSDLEFVRPRKLPWSPMLMNVSIEAFQP